MTPEVRRCEMPGCISHSPASVSETGSVVILVAGPNAIELSGPSRWLLAEGHRWTGVPPGQDALSSLSCLADWLEESFQMASGILVVGEVEPFAGPAETATHFAVVALSGRWRQCA